MEKNEHLTILLDEAEHDSDNYQGQSLSYLRLRRITQTETLILITVVRKPNPVIVYYAYLRAAFVKTSACTKSDQCTAVNFLVYTLL